MSLVQYSIEDKAYRKLLLHALKYHKADCMGLLLGRKQQDNKRVIIDDAVPLFHNKIVSGPLEVAFEMVESTLVDETTRIVGVYEAPILGAETQDTPSPLATAIAQQIKANNQFAEPCILSLSSV
jgi:hypothetical protein